MALPDFLIDAPSHFNWGIDIGTAKEFDAMKLKLNEHIAFNPGVMTVQTLLLQSFIHVSKYKDPKPDYVKGREYLDKAYEEIQHISNEEEKQGFLVVAKCNEAFMALGLEEQTTSLEVEIEDLLLKKTALSQACIDSVRALALSRVGFQKYDEAKMYFNKALEAQPENTARLYRLATLVGRLSRRTDGLDYNDDKEQERGLYRQILTLDNDHALAHVSLAVSLASNGEYSVAMRHASIAHQLAPHHPQLLVKASKVFRKAGCYKAALPILEDASAISGDSAMFHEIGLVYRDIYNDQKRKKEEASRNHERFNRPDKGHLYTAIECFTKALEANPTNNMAQVDRAETYKRLHMVKEAHDDFRSLLTVKNTDIYDQVHFNAAYAAFLQHTCCDEEKACERYRKAINCAVENCLAHPVTRKNPQPMFEGSVRRYLRNAKSGYLEAMEKKEQSTDPETHNQGLKGLAWLDQVYGEHDSARAKYQEYLECDENRNDSDAINSLVKSLIQLGDFEEARKWIQELKELQKLDLVQQLTVECAVVQGEEVQAQGDDELAKELFQEAIECGSIEGCQKLADIITQQPNMSLLVFRTDCAKILQCCEQNEEPNSTLYNEIKEVLNLDNATYGKLRDYHLSLELAILGNAETRLTQSILDKASDTIKEAREMLDRVMISFQKKHYPVTKSHCTFFSIQQDYNQPKTEQQIRDEILKKLMSKYQWDQFDTRFPDLLEFLVKLQPAYPGNTDNWNLALAKLANHVKHCERLRYSHYHIPIMLHVNGKRGVTPIIPRGMPVYGDAPVHQGQQPGVTYELVAVVDVARKAATEVECIVEEFYKYM